MSLQIQKASLNDMKQVTSSGFKMCEVCEVKEIMSIPRVDTVLITFIVTGELCPFNMNRCWLEGEMPHLFSSDQQND
jgi:hypothetical protein